jgi:hypothetical protein
LLSHQFATSLVKKYVVSIELDSDEHLEFGAGHRRTGTENEAGASIDSTEACEWPSDDEIIAALDCGAQKLRELLDAVVESKLYSSLREKSFAKIDVLGHCVTGKYRRTAGAATPADLTIWDDEAPSSEGDDHSDDEEHGLGGDADEPEIDETEAARAGAAPTLSATARNTLRMQAVASALCGDSLHDGPVDCDDDLAKRLADCQFDNAQINAFIREQDPSRMHRFCDQEVCVESWS